MALHPTGLGKGLDALIRETNDPQDALGVRTLPLTDIVPNPMQPRRTFDEKALEELAASIKSQGLLQPLLVRPLGPTNPGKYEIVAGERRWRASQLAGLEEVPVLVRMLSQQDTLAAALIENLQREDLNPIEEAEGIQTLKEEFGLSQDDLAQTLGKSRSAIANTLRLLALPDHIRTLLTEGKLSAGHARALLSVTDPAAQDELARYIQEKKLSVRDAEAMASQWKETGSLFGTPAEPEANESEQQAPDTQGRKSQKGRPQSAIILEIQNKIGELLELPVKVSGKEDKGKISFSYNSKEELERLLQRLSSNVLEGQSLSPLEGSTASALSGQSHAELSSADLTALDGADLTALDGADLTALDGADLAALDGTDLAALDGADLKSLDGTQHAQLGHAEFPVLEGTPQVEALDSGVDEVFVEEEPALQEDIDEAPEASVPSDSSEAPESLESPESLEDMEKEADSVLEQLEHLAQDAEPAQSDADVFEQDFDASDLSAEIAVDLNEDTAEIAADTLDAFKE